MSGTTSGSGWGYFGSMFGGGSGTTAPTSTANTASNPFALDMSSAGAQPAMDAARSNTGSGWNWDAINKGLQNAQGGASMMQRAQGGTPMAGASAAPAPGLHRPQGAAVNLPMSTGYQVQLDLPSLLAARANGTIR